MLQLWGTFNQFLLTVSTKIRYAIVLVSNAPLQAKHASEVEAQRNPSVALSYSTRAAIYFEFCIDAPQN